MDENATTFKLCLLGAPQVGKTSFLNKFVHGWYDDNYKPTLEATFTVRAFMKNNTWYKYRICDPSGDKTIDQLESHIKESSIIVGIYDITSRGSFDMLRGILQSLPQGKKIFIVGNKRDLEQAREVWDQEGEQLRQELGAVSFTEISCQEGASVERFFNDLESTLTVEPTVSRCYKIEPLRRPKFNPHQPVSPSAPLSHVIDVNSNSLLLSSVTYQNRISDVETRKIISDLSDQVRFLKSECERKDLLINQISTIRDSAPSARTSSIEAESMFTLEKIQNYKRDFEAKYEKVATQLWEEKAKNKVKDEEIVELKSELTRLKQELFDFAPIKESLSVKVNELCTHESTENNQRSKIVIVSLQDEIKQLQSRVLELESLLRTATDERDSFETKCTLITKKLSTFNEDLNFDNIDLVVSKFEELRSDHLSTRNQISETNNRIMLIEAEKKAYKDKMEELLGTVRTLEQEAIDNHIQIENLKAERDASISAKQIIEQDIEMLKSKNSDIQRVWLETQKELDIKSGLYAKFEADSAKIDASFDASIKQFKEFREVVAQLLSDDYFKCTNDPEDIKEKINLLMVSSKHRGHTIAILESQIQELNGRLAEEESAKNELQVHVETHLNRISELEEKYKLVDIEIVEKRNFIEKRDLEKEKVYEFLDKLVTLFRLPITSAAVYHTSLEKNLQLILNKIETDINVNSEALTQLKAVEFEKKSYDKKIEALKEQLKNKDIHLDLLRKKIVEIEEEQASMTSRLVSGSKIENSVINKRVNQRIEKLTEEVNKYRSENHSLKARILDIDTIKEEKAKKEEDIKALLVKITQLEDENKKTWLRLEEIRNYFEENSLDLENTRSSTDKVIKALNLEARALKQELENLKKREQQLLDFRNSIIKKLGLSLESMRLADYEILARLEALYLQQVTPTVQLLPVQNCLLPANCTINPCKTHVVDDCSTSHRHQSQHHHHHQHCDHQIKLKTTTCHTHLE